LPDWRLTGDRGEGLAEPVEGGDGVKGGDRWSSILCVSRKNPHK